MDPRDLPEMPELMIVGPGELHDEDLAVLGKQVIAHYGDTWVEAHNDAVRALARLLGAPEDPYVIPGSGTACLDAALMNLFEPGERIVVAGTGFFGVRLAEVATAVGLDVVEVPVAVGEPADARAIADAVASTGAAGVAMTHVETSTGVRHPIAAVGRAVHESGALLVVDGIASIGGETFDLEDMGVDALVTSTQKGLETPPGLGIVALGPAARRRLESRRTAVRSWYLDLRRWDWYRREWGWHPHPVTMPTSLVLTLLSSVNRILNFGLDSWIADRAALAARCREGLESIGLPAVPRSDVQSNMVIAAYADDGPEIQRRLLEDGLQISGGLAPLAGRTIRIGLMGRTATEAMVDRVLDAIARARKDPGA